MIEKHDTNTYLFQEKPQQKENGNRNFRFYNKYLRLQIDKIMERKEECKLRGIEI